MQRNIITFHELITTHDYASNAQIPLVYDRPTMRTHRKKLGSLDKITTNSQKVLTLKLFSAVPDILFFLSTPPRSLENNRDAWS